MFGHEVTFSSTTSSSENGTNRERKTLRRMPQWSWQGNSSKHVFQKKKRKKERTENLVKKVKEGRERTQWVTVTINGVRKRERIYKKTGSKS